GMTPPSERCIAPGDLVTTELTPAVTGYFAQICRTLVVGKATDAQRHAFDVFREALAAGVAAVRPGATAADVARAENDVFRNSGLGEYTTSKWTRVRGHGLGLFCDSKPHLLEDVNTPLAPSMALIVHPNTYHPEVGYVVLGDAVVVTESGAEVLCKTPRELFEVAAGGEHATRPDLPFEGGAARRGARRAPRPRARGDGRGRPRCAPPLYQQYARGRRVLAHRLRAVLVGGAAGGAARSGAGAGGGAQLSRQELDRAYEPRRPSRPWSAHRVRSRAHDCGVESRCRTGHRRSRRPRRGDRRRLAPRRPAPDRKRRDAAVCAAARRGGSGGDRV